MGTYYYPNDQSARLVWYHDHAIGITRLNAYAGIASAYIVTDAFETFLLNQGLLPDLVGVPLVIQDKTFFDPASDPNYPVTGARPGDLWYPWDYEKDTDPIGRWAYGPDETPPAVIPNPNLPPISAVPEFFADTAMVNGAPYPLLTVKEGTFRLRLLNGSQARFWHLNLYHENPVGSGEVTSTLTSYGKPDLSTAIPGPIMYQVATEGGFLPAVAIHNNTTPIPLDLIGDPSGNSANPDGPFNLLLGPAERADILIDFSGLNGQSFILYNDAPGPFPGGDSRTDYFTGDPDQTAIGGAPSTQPLKGPNTRTIMKIVVDNSKGITGGPFPNLAALNTALNQNFFGGNPVPPQQPIPLDPTGFTPLIKTLNEDFDDYGRLVQRGGTEQSFTNNQGGTTFGMDYISQVTENPSAGETQVWDFYNNTGDTHPWHFHLVNVQIVGRGIFAHTEDGLDFPVPTFGTFTDLQGNPGQLTPPDPNEQGWKETVRMNPGEVTRVIIKFDLPNLPTQAMRDAVSPRTGGHEYVHHCHILEHEEHDMMRPLVVT
jgi:spore coat protein A